MYTTVRHYEGVTDIDAVVQSMNEGFLDSIRQVPGFINYSAVDAGGGTLVTISVFEDRSGVEESDRRAAQWIQEHNLASIIPNPPQISEGEVVAQASAGPVSGVTDTVGGVTDTVGGVTDPVRGTTDRLLGGEEKQR
jgi:hypothetical protein